MPVFNEGYFHRRISSPIVHDTGHLQRGRQAEAASRYLRRCRLSADIFSAAFRRHAARCLTPRHAFERAIIFAFSPPC
jgi:hypothetical protein